MERGEVGQLEQLALRSPHGLDQHLAELHAQNGLLEVALATHHVHHGMYVLHHTAQHLLQVVL